MSKRNKKKDITDVPKPIIITAKSLQFLSHNLVTKFATKLFTTPIRHKIPKREYHMEENSTQNTLLIPSIQKEIVVYHYGESAKKILLVHGWSGRGTQLVKIADELVKNGFATISFDAPAHGKSKGNFSIMTEFIASILEIEKQYGPFEYAIGHSLGGMSILNALKQNLNVKKAVIIGSGDKVRDILDDFIKKLELKPIIAEKLQSNFERKFGKPMNNYSGYIAAQEISIPLLVIHDENDTEVSVKAAHHIHQHLNKSEIMITKELGHRKILGDTKVINKIVEFITL
jgi:pimeloyl-ACP methyl ester carboxylesterase